MSARIALFTLMVTAICVTFSSSAMAGVILAPVSATASATDGGTATHTIDQSGLSLPYISGATDFDVYIAAGPTHDYPGEDNAWAAYVPPFPVNLDYDLGAAYTIETLALWTSFDGFSIDRFQVFTADNPGFVGALSVGVFDANDTNPPMPAQLFDLLDSNARYLRVHILTNEGGVAVNLGEMALEVSAVPEPLLPALLGIGALVRRVVSRRELH